MIRAITFDWGGIFTEGTFDADAVTNLAALCTVDEERISRTYYPLMARFETGSLDLDEFITRFEEESGLSFETERFRATFLASGRERGAMYRVLDAIPDHYRVAVLSNNVPVLCDQVRNDPRMARVEKFLFSNELGVRKPAAEAFDALSSALDLPPAEILFIDDSAANIAACRELGFAGIQLDDFEQFRRELERHAPDFRLETS
ncbi:MAG: HAD family phosphatase [Trueperaceae bacterium]